LALNIHSGNGLYGPPLVQQNTPSHPERLGASYRNGDVGYTNEKRTPAATESREEVRGYIELDVPNHASPIALTSRIVSVIETSEVQGSLPPKRHELGNNE
jgi:hypothetical protein